MHHNHTASQQNRQSVVASTHATTHKPSKPPARPAPPSIGMSHISKTSVRRMVRFVFNYLCVAGKHCSFFV